MIKLKPISTLVFVVFQLAFTSNIYAGKASDNSTEKILLTSFTSAKEELQNMLSGKTTLNFEKAIFLMENAYWGNTVDYTYFNSAIEYHVNNIQSIVNANRNYSTQNFKATFVETVDQQKDKYEQALANWAIFKYVTEPTSFDKENSIYLHFPFQYSTNDPLGTVDWRNTQVLNLLNTKIKTGNCFALATLFKIFADRLNSGAILCTAPGHIYIRHADHKGIFHNIELATRSFPGTGTLETLTYTTDAATKNGLSLRELDLKQSIALCLVYLSKGYEHTFNINDDNFNLECSEVALQHDSLNLNAMLLKAEVLEERIIKKRKSVLQMKNDSEFQEFEKLVSALYKLGYREMPVEMKDYVLAKLRNDESAIIVKDHTPQPHAHLGVKENRYATLSGGLFDEMHETKPFEQYQRTIFDTKKSKIIKFVALDTTYNNYPIDMVVFAWSIDPLAHKFPSESPYSAFGNNPIQNIDVGGAYKYPADKAASYKKDYPMITKYLATQVHSDMMNSSKILNAYAASTDGNLTSEKVSEMTTWNNGPEIRFVDEPTWPYPGGKGKYEPYGDHIVLRQDDAAAIEKILNSDASEEEKMAAFLPFYKTLGHETTHAGNYKNYERIVKGVEVGYDYEQHVYGSDVFNPYNDDMYNPETAKKVIMEQGKTEEGKATLPTLPK